MTCPDCGHVNALDASACVACGTSLLPRCAACRRQTPRDAAFCPSCGIPLHRVASDGSDELGAPARGERRTATVLFSDLSGYTELNERLAPEDVAMVMSQIKDAATRIVESYGGTVNQFVGDQVLALFGVPTAHDDDPVRAVRAALGLHAFVRDLGAQVESRVGRRISLHTAVNSGLLLAERRDQRDGVYAVTGDAVNTGARLLGVAATDEIVVGPTTHHSIAPFFALARFGVLRLRGRGEPVEVHRVLGVVARSRFEVAQRRGLSQLVGRERELARLDDRLTALEHGRGGLVTVSGQAGIGKSRLFHEFRTTAEQRSFDVHHARCEPFGAVAPYAPFVQLLRQALGVQNDDSSEELQAKAVDRIRSLDPSLEGHLPVYLHLLSVRSEEHALSRGTSGEGVRRGDPGGTPRRPLE